MSAPKVICLGEAMVELSLDANSPGAAGIGYAGDTLNTAIYLKRMAPAVQVSYATKVGDDPLSGQMIDLMAREGLDTRLVSVAKAALPGLYAISTNASGERSFMYWRNASAARDMFRQPGLTFDTLGAADVLYFSAISLAILPADDVQALLEWLPRFRQAGGRVAFDSNYRPALWPDVETAQRVVSAAWRQTDIAFPSLDDETALFGDPDEAALMTRFGSYGAINGALKRGETGPRALDGSASGSFSPATDVRDTTAAGDSFNGAYLAAHLSGKSQKTCLQAGHELARAVISYKGAIIPADVKIS